LTPPGPGSVAIKCANSPTIDFIICRFTCGIINSLGTGKSPFRAEKNSGGQGRALTLKSGSRQAGSAKRRTLEQTGMSWFSNSHFAVHGGFREMKIYDDCREYPANRVAYQLVFIKA
jgi:hypothetical protein